MLETHFTTGNQSISLIFLVYKLGVESAASIVSRGQQLSEHDETRPGEQGWRVRAKDLPGKSQILHPRSGGSGRCSLHCQHHLTCVRNREKKGALARFCMDQYCLILISWVSSGFAHSCWRIWLLSVHMSYNQNLPNLLSLLQFNAAVGPISRDCLFCKRCAQVLCFVSLPILQTYIHVCMNACMYVCLCALTRACRYTYTDTYLYTYTWWKKTRLNR